MSPYYDTRIPAHPRPIRTQTEARAAVSLIAFKRETLFRDVIDPILFYTHLPHPLTPPSTPTSPEEVNRQQGWNPGTTQGHVDLSPTTMEKTHQGTQTNCISGRFVGPIASI
ncbi:hypothetical protein CEXT_194991 [Caerostris extrusa]|uniref:Uncharacterized protein n=1 Tax=Caerostris extrusa TaxID=172846 RepID=A0AAV4MB13_CAEEX|nr:hypothetical protein CEXT_194991 [Caerostris extrusa]